LLLFLLKAPFGQRITWRLGDRSERECLKHDLEQGALSPRSVGVAVLQSLGSPNLVCGTAGPGGASAGGDGDGAASMLSAQSLAAQPPAFAVSMGCSLGPIHLINNFDCCFIGS